MRASELKVGLRVHRGDTQQLGTVERLLGRARVGGGVHARVAWDSGGSSVVRPDLLTLVHQVNDEDIFPGREVLSKNTCDTRHGQA